MKTTWTTQHSGIGGSTRNDSSLNRWAITYIARSEMSQSTKEMFGVDPTPDEGKTKHKELGRNDEISEELITAKDTGDILLGYFVQERLIEQSVSLYKPITKRRLKTMSTLYQVHIRGS